MIPFKWQFQCITDINECQSSPCVQGNCTDYVNNYTCECQPGFRGVNCDTGMESMHFMTSNISFFSFRPWNALLHLYNELCSSVQETYRTVHKANRTMQKAFKILYAKPARKRPKSVRCRAVSVKLPYAANWFNVFRWYGRILSLKKWTFLI